MKKLKLLFSFIVLFAVVGTIIGCESTLQAENSYVTIDINPSVELIVSPKDKIVYANPLNGDAEVLLSGLDLIGMNLDDAIDLIIETSIELGYISTNEDQETFVAVSTVSADEALQERLQKRVKDHINKSFEKRAMFGKGTDKGFDQEFLDEAMAYDVAPRFLFLAYKVVELDDAYLLDDALLLSEAELLEIVKIARSQNQGLVMELRNQFFLDRAVIFELYYDDIKDLEAQIIIIKDDIAKLEEDVESSELILNLENLEIELEFLKETLHNDIKTLREEFKAQRGTFENQFKEERQQRKAENQNQMNQFQEQMKERRNRHKEQIEAFQKNTENTNRSTQKRP